MRRWYASLCLLLPLIAAGPAAAADTQALPDQQSRATATDPQAVTGTTSSGSMLLRVWRADNGQSWSLLARSAAAPTSDESLDFKGLGFAWQSGGALEYTLNPRWTAHARVLQQSWLGASSVGNCLSLDLTMRRDQCASGGMTPRLMQSEVGATFRGIGYSLGMDVRSTQPTSTTALLPRVVPNAPLSTRINGLPFASLDGSTSVRARGRVAVGERSGIDLGASVGRIRLLPGNVLGIDTLGQKSLSFGMDSGALSGHIIGRVIEPTSGASRSILGPDHRWTSIDLGITWRLPWQGSLSFGARNLWSSGHVPEPKEGPKADASRIPYVQYHQDF